VPGTLCYLYRATHRSCDLMVDDLASGAFARGRKDGYPSSIQSFSNQSRKTTGS
jgi:hypothetical protein